MGYTIPLWANLEVRPPVSKLDARWNARYTMADKSLPIFKTAELEFMDKHHVFKQSVVEGQQFGNNQTGECPIKNVKGLPDSDYLKLTNPFYTILYNFLFNSSSVSSNALSLPGFKIVTDEF
jgi:hypothetical protein